MNFIISMTLTSSNFDRPSSSRVPQSPIRSCLVIVFSFPSSSSQLLQNLLCATKYADMRKIVVKVHLTFPQWMSYLRIRSLVSTKANEIVKDELLNSVNGYEFRRECWKKRQTFIHKNAAYAAHQVGRINKVLQATWAILNYLIIHKKGNMETFPFLTTL